MDIRMLKRIVCMIISVAILSISMMYVYTNYIYKSDYVISNEAKRPAYVVAMFAPATQPSARCSSITIANMAMDIPLSGISNVSVVESGGRPSLVCQYSNIRIYIYMPAHLSGTSHLYRLKLRNMPRHIADDEVNCQGAIYESCSQVDSASRIFQVNSNVDAKLRGMAALLLIGPEISHIELLRSSCNKGILKRYSNPRGHCEVGEFQYYSNDECTVGMVVYDSASDNGLDVLRMIIGSMCWKDDEAVSEEVSVTSLERACLHLQRNIQDVK